MCSRFASTVVLFAFLTPSLAQITGSPHAVDTLAVKLTDDVVSKLQNVKWYLHEHITVLRGDTSLFNVWTTLQFLDGGRIDGGGTWQRSDRFLTLTPPPEKRNAVLNGHYSVYTITDTCLVIAKVLTTSGDFKKLYAFKSHPKPQKQWPSSWQPPQSAKPVGKSGKYVTYHDNGRIKTEGEHVLRRRHIIAKEKFVTWDDVEGDSVFYQADIGWQKRFDENGRLIERNFYDRNGFVLRDVMHYTPAGDYYAERSTIHGTGFLISDSVLLVQRDYLRVTRSGDRQSITLKLFGHGKSGTTIQLTGVPEIQLAGSTFQLPVNDTISVTLAYTVPPGAKDFPIWLNTPTGKFDVRLHTWGFDLDRTDFAKPGPIVLRRPVHYLKTSDEYQIEITGINNATRRVMTTATSQQLCEIDVPKGRYKLTLVTPSNRLTQVVDIR